MDFVKYHVSYSDYIVSDDVGAERYAASVCDRHAGVGAYGLVSVRENPFRAHFFRPDGREVPLDFSAALCAGAYLCEKSGSPKICIVTASGVCETEISKSGAVSAVVPYKNAGEAKIRRADVGAGTEYVKTILCNTTRAVCKVNDIYKAILFGVGEKMSAYGAFGGGADVDFTRAISRDKIEVKSYERGVGYLTSGSGAVAAAVTLASLGVCEKNVNVAVDCGRMRVYTGDELRLEATVAKVMKGTT